MQSLLLTLHIIVCVLLVVLILLQAGKEGMGVIFGGGNTTLFGSTGAGGILVKLTTLMALIFVVTSLSYTYITSSHVEKESTILDVRIEEPAPAQKPSDQALPQPATNPTGDEKSAVKADETAKTDTPKGQKTETPAQGGDAQKNPAPNTAKDKK